MMFIGGIMGAIMGMAGLGFLNICDKVIFDVYTLLFDDNTL